MELPESGVSGVPEPPKPSSSKPASASITADAPESLRNTRRFISFMGGGGSFLFVPLLFKGFWFWYSLHLQSAPSYAILMNRTRSCLLTHFVHSDRLSAPAQDFFWLYCTIPGKKLPPQKSRFLGGNSKKIFGVLGLPPQKIPPPKKPQIGGILGDFPTKTGSCSPACAGFPPLAAMCGKES